MSDHPSQPMTGPEAPTLLALEAREAGYKKRIEELEGALKRYQDGSHEWRRRAEAAEAELTSCRECRAKIDCLSRGAK